ncbi:radical SAM protein [Magnetospirillum aberrantis]|uniref:Radical SAM protein n=1 Tax=Magnetospirillum aberrantis SpK TaxID=908842 RepID=A0A7C9UU92_9PROT|nr:radical SAM protein [Magnetospirillum aberrantis]NFV80126.1 radical SAM protein [Magnetospirillum aberrantis SpK]
MLAYDFPLWRPPSEGDNLIIQATLGCGFNGCTFCSMYKVKEYQERPLAAVFADIEQAARVWPQASRVFLADGDAYGLPTEALLAICGKLQQCFPALTRVSAYATPFNLLKKSVDEIQSLKAARLSLVYVGIESGSDLILKKIAKGTSKVMAQGLAHAAEAGLKVSATVITGLGGKTHWQEHVDATADLLNRVPVTYLSTLQLGLEEEVAPRFFERFGEPFVWQDDAGVLEELARLVERLDPPRPVIFRSNHASNALPLAGTLPKDRDKVLAQIELARNGGRGLRPEWLRGL